MSVEVSEGQLMSLEVKEGYSSLSEVSDARSCQQRSAEVDSSGQKR